MKKIVQKLVLLGTGGTIAGTASSAQDNLGYSAAQIGVQQLAAAIPALPEALKGCELVCEQVAQLDSKDMDWDTMARIAQRCSHWLAQSDVQGIVITHGTDTLEETAFFLRSVLNPSKPVVLTCAMRPATSSEADGPRNVLDAVAVALDAQAQGVLCVCAGDVHSAEHVQKVHTYALNAFSSGDAGPVARVQGRAVLWNSDKDAFLKQKEPLAQQNRAWAAIESIAPVQTWPRVEIVMNYASARGQTVDALVASGVQGIVVAGTGNGTLHHDLQAALLRAQAAGVVVWRSTRCVFGSVMPVPGDVLPDSQGLSPVKARLALMLSLLPRT
jgi:L-asparaginase